MNGGAGANDITASRPGVVVALQVVRGPRERVGDPLVDYQHRPDVDEYRRHRGSGCSYRTGRDRRGDHALAEEQYGAEEAQRGQRHGGADDPAAPPYRRSSVMSAMNVPPPSLSARITSVTLQLGEPRLPSDTITSGRPVSADGRSFQALYRSLSWCVV